MWPRQRIQHRCRLQRRRRRIDRQPTPPGNESDLIKFPIINRRLLRLPLEMQRHRKGCAEFELKKDELISDESNRKKNKRQKRNRKSNDCQLIRKKKERPGVDQKKSS